jgi:hypothetical protein
MEALNVGFMDPLQQPDQVGALNQSRLPPIDNYATERSICPFFIGRKKWLFSDTPKVATASAQIFSLVEKAKVNDQEP